MKVNGKIILLQKDINLFDFLINNNYEISKIAVELNKKIIVKAEFKNIALNDSDSLEIVTFVGGG
ncbi:MAG: sulfur carrier protein ThiS [Endomicrobiaceae bacterium]